MAWGVGVNTLPPSRNLGAYRHPLHVERLVASACTSQAYWFPKASSDRDLFLFGVRNPSRTLGRFDDVLGACWVVDGEWDCRLWRGTTDPGLDGDKAHNPRLHSQGTAILQPGQYRGMWKLGIHRAGKPGGHEAFRQNKPATFWRDRVADGVMTTGGELVSDIIWCNGHKPYRDGLTRVGMASLACQVWWSRAEHDEAMAMAREQIAAHPTWQSFTYTLFDARTSPELLALLYAVGAA